jgi:hypothetical protein
MHADTTSSDQRTVANPYARTIQIAWIVAGVSAVSFIVGLLLRRATTTAWPVLLLAGGAMLLLGCVITLPVLYLYGRLARRHIEAVLNGGHWAHWTYGRTEWEKFAEAEWAKARGNAVRTGLQAAGMMVVAGIAFHFLSDTVSLAEGATLGVASGVGLGAIVGILSLLFARAAHRSRLATRGEVYIARGGVYQNGSYTSWEMAGVTLDGVTLEPGDPAVLQFAISVSRGGSTKLRVAVPSGKQADARLIVERFGERQGGVSAGDERVARWLEELTGRLEPDKITFGPGERLVDVFQRTFAQEEIAVREHEKDPDIRATKLKALDELRQRFC